MHVFEAVLGLVVLATAVAGLAERVRLPPPSVLVVVGLAVGLLPGFPTFRVTPQVVLVGVLPPLLFAAAQQVSLPDLTASWAPVVALATGLVAVTAVAVALVTHGIDGSVGLAPAFVLGAVLASTDPVAVTALSRRMRLPTRVATVVQAESLFNDATSLVLFQLAVGVVVAAHTTAGSVVVHLLRLAGGGLVLGVVVGWLAGWLIRRTHEPTLQAAISVLTPYVAAVVAEVLQLSGVTAVIVAGLALSHRHGRLAEPRGRLVAAAVYDVAVFLLESAVFALIGLQLASFIRDLPAGDGASAWQLLLVVTAVLLAARAAGLFAGALWSRRRRPGVSTRSWSVAAVVTWSGARGVVPLAAALAIPLTGNDGRPFPHRPLLLVVATASVVLSLAVQGTTLEPLVRRLSVAGDATQAFEEATRARYATLNAAMAALASVAADEEVPAAVVKRVRTELEQRMDAVGSRISDEGGDVSGVQAARRLRYRLLTVQSEELARLRTAGQIGPDTYRRLLREIDLEQARLGE